MKPLVVRVGHEVALPFVSAYCSRFNLRVDNLDKAKDIWWWGAINEGSMRSVMGLEVTSQTEMYVWGWFGDGSGTLSERRCLQRLIQVLDDIPYELSGTILVDNSAAQRYAARHGWAFGNFCTIDGVDAVQVRRPILKPAEACFG